MAALSHISGFLNAQGAQYELGGRLHAPRLWTIVLAPSGSGKSLACSTTGRWLSGETGESIVPQLLNAASSARFVANISDTPKGLWVRDEFGQFLSQLQSLPHLEEIKDILLRAYSGEAIERRTKDVQIEIADHALSILGITVGETFEKQIGADSLVDGFAQRFNYICAHPDSDRPMYKFPIYFEDMDSPEALTIFNRLRKGWIEVSERKDLESSVFTFSQDSIDLFKDGFQRLFPEVEIPGSFFRRSMFSVFSYASIFHVAAGKPGTYISQDSMSLALRMVAMHLDHAKLLLRGYGISELEGIVRKAEALVSKRSARGQETKPRDLIANIRLIRSAPQAQSILNLIRQ